MDEMTMAEPSPAKRSSLLEEQETSSDVVSLPYGVDVVEQKVYRPWTEARRQGSLYAAFLANQSVPAAIRVPSSAVKDWLSSAQRATAQVLDPCHTSEFREAQDELDRVKEAAVAEDFPEPTDELVREAGELLRWMYRELPYTYDVTPEDDGGIAIHAVHDEVYVCIVLSHAGPDRCFVNMDGESRISQFTERSKLCGTFLRGALQDLRRCAG